MKRLFDVSAFWNLSSDTNTDKIEDFIESEIKRNVREALAKARHVGSIDQIRMNDKCRECQLEIWREWDEKIDEILKEMEGK